MADLIVTERLSIPLAEFQITFARSSGPGGQNVNKVSSKAVIRWPVVVSPSLPEELRTRFLVKFKSRITADGEIIVTSQRFRDAWRNSADCLEKLREMVASVASPPKRRRKTRPTKSSVRRRLASKREQSERKRERRRPKLEQ